MAGALEPVTLAGDHVRLEPLTLDHAGGLAAAAASERSSFGYTWVPHGVDATESYIRSLLAQHAAGEVLPFAQRSLDSGDLVGCTRFMELRYWRGRDVPDEVEIGGTWLAARAQRTAINTEAKLLLLQQAFDEFGVWRVALCTDARNQRSREAIERIGARFEGILHNHRLRADTDVPTPRQSAMFAITVDDWPSVRSRLSDRLAR